MPWADALFDQHTYHIWDTWNSHCLAISGIEACGSCADGRIALFFLNGVLMTNQRQPMRSQLCWNSNQDCCRQQQFSTGLRLSTLEEKLACF